MENTTLVILLVLAALVIGGLIGMTVGRRQRTKLLQEKFGPEYDHALDELGSQRRAERELEARLNHVKALDIRPLTAEEIDRFTSEWQAIQAEFVDEPIAALQKADRLVGEAMKARGFPVEDAEQKEADLSVLYPNFVTDYRGMHSIAVKGPGQKVGTEEMRKAMIHGRALFENLVKQQAETVEEAEKERVI